ncbi:MAG: zf-TFIIB domain-containing protein [Acidobacteriota bacterium]
MSEASSSPPVLPPLPADALTPAPRVSARECPVCPGLLLETWSPDNARELEIDRCRRCAGVLFDADEVEQLRHVRSRSVLAWLRPPSYELPRPCPACSTPLARDAAACTVCGRENHIDCPSCGAQMDIVEHEGKRVDRCRACHAVWLDAHELALVWTGLALALGAPLAAGALSTTAADVANAAPSLGELAGGAAEVAAHVDPWLLELGARAALEAAPMVARGGGVLLDGAGKALSHAPGAAGAAVEGLGQLAGAIVEALAQLLGAVADL